MAPTSLAEAIAPRTGKIIQKNSPFSKTLRPFLATVKN